jgi:hypothetical protein
MKNWNRRIGKMQMLYRSFNFMASKTEAFCLSLFIQISEMHST